MAGFDTQEHPHVVNTERFKLIISHTFGVEGSSILG